jgi:hypothetical protein
LTFRICYFDGVLFVFAGVVFLLVRVISWIVSPVYEDANILDQDRTSVGNR